MMVGGTRDVDEVADWLARGGFIAAEEEAAELCAAAAGDRERLHTMLERRLTGEPLAWITGGTTLCGERVIVHPGVYVPRWHTEPLAERAAALLPEGGRAVDVCTGSGAIAKVLLARNGSAAVIATDIDERAVMCARANGVDARLGDLLAPVPEEWRGHVDVVTAVVPYVPTAELALLQRDTFAFETDRAYDGGGDGMDLLRRVVIDAAPVLRLRGVLLLELGGAQADVLEPHLRMHGYARRAVLRDDDGDVRGIEAVLSRRVS